MVIGYGSQNIENRWPIVQAFQWQIRVAPLALRQPTNKEEEEEEQSYEGREEHHCEGSRIVSIQESGYTKSDEFRCKLLACLLQRDKGISRRSRQPAVVSRLGGEVVPIITQALRVRAQGLCHLPHAKVRQHSKQVKSTVIALLRCCVRTPARSFIALSASLNTQRCSLIARELAQKFEKSREVVITRVCDQDASIRHATYDMYALFLSSSPAASRTAK